MSSLYPREIQVLQLLAAGFTTRRVAEEMGISPETVKSYLKRIFQVLGANSRTHAVAIAIRNGIIE